MRSSILGKIFLGVGLVIVIPFAVFFVIDLRQRNIKTSINEKDLIPVLRDGDIICRLGDRIWSLVFKEFSPNDKRYSHLGIVVIQDGEIKIVNAEGSREENNDKVQIVSLKEFLQFARNIGIYRAKEIDGNSISAAALEYVDRPFDWDFDMDDDSKLYCSELLYVTLKKIAKDLPVKTVWVKELSKNIIPVDIGSEPNYFVEIGHYGN
jgi:uncharacterized protein YycO